MKSFKLIFAACVASAAMVVPALNAQTVHVVAAGSSALYTQTAVATVNDVASRTSTFTGGGSIHHFTIKGTSCTEGQCAFLNDTRAAGIPKETGTFWAVWVCPAAGCDATHPASDVWSDQQVDSIVGDREYLGRATSNLAPGTDIATSTAADHAIDNVNPALFDYGVNNTNAACGTATTCDDLYLPDSVWQALSGAAGVTLNTSFTDIRAEDAFYGTNRALGTPADTAAPWIKLGYGPGPVGVGIQSSYTATFATPVAFGLPGTNDPIDGHAVPSTIKQFPIGEEAIVFITNRTNANGLGYKTGVVPYYRNVIDNGPSGGASNFGTASPIGQLFGGTNCSGTSAAWGYGGALPGGLSNFPVNPQLREPLSGTMNTTEFTALNTFGGSLDSDTYGIGVSAVENSPRIVPGTSQEANVLAANPLNAVCPGGGVEGTRRRTVGSGEEVGKPGGTGVGLTQDSIGYTFFAFGNEAPLGNNPNYGYLTLDGVDPTFNKYTGGDPGQPATGGAEQGQMPTCNVALGNGAGGCTVNAVWTGGLSYPHLRDGTYRAWAIVRALCDTASATCSFSSDNFGTEALIRYAQDEIHNSVAKSVADFLPLSDDGTFGPVGTNFGDAQFLRSHYAYNTAVGGPNFEYPDNRANSEAGFSLNAVTFPGGTAIADLANGISPTSPEVGGDVGGCIIRTQDSGLVLKLSAAVYPGPIPSNPHMKFTYSNPVNPGVPLIYGVCGGPDHPGRTCYESNTAAQCGTQAADTCNPPPGIGMSIAVAGVTNNKDNGVWQVSKITDATDIKVKVLQGRLGDVTPVQLPNTGADSIATVSTGCVQ